MSNKVHIETIINASPEDVRAVVLNFPTYSKWQTKFPSSITLPPHKSGPDLQPGDTVFATFLRPDGNTASINAEILCNEPGEFRWRGNAGPWGAFAADHYWRFEGIEESGGNEEVREGGEGEGGEGKEKGKRIRTRFLHGEVYIGWAGFLFREGWAPWRMARGMFEGYSVELKRRVEEVYPWNG